MSLDAKMAEALDQAGVTDSANYREYLARLCARVPREHYAAVLEPAGAFCERYHVTRGDAVNVDALGHSPQCEANHVPVFRLREGGEADA